MTSRYCAQLKTQFSIENVDNLKRTKRRTSGMKSRTTASGMYLETALVTKRAVAFKLMPFCSNWLGWPPRSGSWGQSSEGFRRIHQNNCQCVPLARQPHERTDAGSAAQSCTKLLQHVLCWKAHSFPMRNWGATWRHAHPERSILSIGLFVPCTVHIIPIEYHPCIALHSCFSTLV